MITGEHIEVIRLTLLVGVAATGAMLPPGVALAWWLARCDAAYKAIV